ncbi:MAG: class B sortase [Propionibacteriaceae bacterium]|nr:class B sortase [Propionibacteriaceae bacterium]
MRNSAKAIGRQVIKGASQIVDLATLIVIVSLLAFAGYSLWDSEQIYNGADREHHASWKPTVDDGASFEELRSINPEVFAWLTVYGTNIDYPIAQGPDNQKYVSTNIEGQFSLSGSLFLDADNDSSFADFNSIIYGHHMAKDAMFGDLGDFADKAVFDAHRFGNLYFDGVDHGVEFISFMHVDAYDSGVYTAGVDGEERRQAYLDGLATKALYDRGVAVGVNDRLVLLSTCSASSTNGRDILVGVIRDQPYPDSYEQARLAGLDRGDGVDSPVAWVAKLPGGALWASGGLVLAGLALLVVLLVRRRRGRGGRGGARRGAVEESRP